MAAGCRPMRLQLEAAPPSHGSSSSSSLLEDMPRTLFAALARKYASQVRCSPKPYALIAAGGGAPLAVRVAGAAPGPRALHPA